MIHFVHFSINPRTTAEGNIVLKVRDVPVVVCIVFAVLAVGGAVVGIEMWRRYGVGTTLILAGLVGAVASIRLLSTGTVVEVLKATEEVGWTRTGWFGTSSRTLDQTELRLTLHPTSLVVGEVGWSGYAVTLVNVQGQALDLARSGDRTAMLAYATKLSEETNIGWEETPEPKSVLWT